MTTTTLRSIACIAVLTLAAHATAQTWEQRQKLTTEDSASEYFGFSVALSGDTALIGAFYSDVLTWTSGLAHVFEKVNGVWTQVAELRASNGTTDDCFGESISLSGDTALVTAPGSWYRESGPGAAYVFERVSGVWTQVAKLTASDGTEHDHFGDSVALSGATALVGRLSDGNRGSAYVFEKVSGVWTQVAKLTASDGATDDYFGDAVALLGATALVGAPYDDDRGEGSGSVYVFEKVNGVWTQTAKLTASDGAGGDAFGCSVVLSGDTALVGADGADDRGEYSGAAYVFQNINGVWTQTAKLTADDGTGDEGFGGSVAISGDTALVGAYHDDDRGSYSGSAYVFQKIKGVWTQAAKLTADDGAAFDYFGYSVAISGDASIIGAFGDDDRGSFSGSAYAFEHVFHCTDLERIAKAACATVNGFNVLTIVLAKATPGDSFTVTLSTGASKTGTIDSRGKGKAKFKRLPSGDGIATAEWGCGATAEKTYSCR